MSSREDRLTNRTSFVRIDEFLLYIARRVTIAFGYSHAWREKRNQTFGDTSTIKQESFSDGSVVASLVALSPSHVVIRKGDGNASIRVREKRMKRGELHGVSKIHFFYDVKMTRPLEVSPRIGQ